eukprot:364374-Chlamydomonas_euryale.AAC.3
MGRLRKVQGTGRRGKGRDSTPGMTDKRLPYKKGTQMQLWSTIMGNAMVLSVCDCEEQGQEGKSGLFILMSKSSRCLHLTEWMDGWMDGWTDWCLGNA